MDNIILFEERGQIGHLILNDPPANKMTKDFFVEFHSLVREKIIKSSVKGIIIYGNRHYSSGADFGQIRDIVMASTTVDNDEIISYSSFLITTRNSLNFFSSLSIPVVSAIRGFCIGSGLELALYSHIRICGTNGMIGLPESTFGYLPGLGGTYKLASLIGYGKGSELILSGEILTAEDAYKYGIVDKVIHKNHVITYAEKLLNLIIKNEPNYSKKDALSYITKYENSIILDS